MSTLPDSTISEAVICNAVRARLHGYQLRCLELDGHLGEHRWTPELLVDAPQHAG